MPNLQQMLMLKEKYNKLSKNEIDAKNYLNINFVKNEKLMQKSFDTQLFFEHLNVKKSRPQLIEYFEKQQSVDVVLLYIDITGFSIITEGKTQNEIINYLDDFYIRTFPIIYENNGQIEKLMGDGIICMFGKPFINESRGKEFKYAVRTAADLIKEFKNTNKEIKVALHSGLITYYKTPVDSYTEYTMIGKTLTELYRLESVSKNNAINYYKGSEFDKRITKNRSNPQKIKILGKPLNVFTVDIPGIDYNAICNFDV